MSETALDTSRRRFLGGTVIGLAGLAGIAASGIAPAAAITTSTEPNAADIGFLTDMTAHHVQALAMCQRVLGRDTGDPVQAAAAEVLQNQAIEVGMMRAWLTDWNQSTAEPRSVMEWMGVDFCLVDHSMMPGVATSAQMQALSLAEGRDQGRMWLELMRAHHIGGVDMAAAAIPLVAVDKVRRIAETQVKVQGFEIAQYDQLLTVDYA